MHGIFNNIFDYAGLFPPTEFSMDRAVDEYIRVLDEPEGELVDRFLVTARRVPELTAILRKKGIDEGFPVSVIASPFQFGSLQNDWELSQDPCLSLEGFELKMPFGLVEKGILKEIRGSKPYNDLGESFFLEFRLDEHCYDNLHESTAVLEAAGFKARTGGMEVEDFPSPETLAQWIFDTTSLGTTVKFTAGLHQSLRHLDKNLGTKRHGFANILVAFVACEALDLNTREVEQILEIESASEFKWTEEGFVLEQGEVDGLMLEEAMERFGGIGSCSIDEPWDSLKKAGWL